MKKRIRYIIVVILAVMLISIPIIVYAATWNYSMVITIQDTSGSTRTNLPVDTGIGGTSLYSAGYITASGLNSDIASNGGDIPYMLGTTHSFSFVNSLLANSQAINTLYMGYSPAQTNLKLMVGNNGYITTNDAAGLEPGNNFIWEYDGYFDTSAGASKYFLSKASEIYGDAGTTLANYITSYYVAETLEESQTSSGSSFGDVYGNNWSGQTFTTASSWGLERVAITVAGLTGSPTNPYLHIRATSGGLPTGSDLATVGGSYAGGVLTFTFNNPLILSQSTVYSESVSCTGTSGDKYNLGGSNANPYSGGQYISTTDGGVTWAGNASNDLKFYNYYYPAVQRAVSSGYHNVKIYADTTYFGLMVDGLTNAINLYGTSVPDTANNWVLMQNNSMPYANYIKETVSGTEVLKYQPNSMVGTVSYSTGTATFTQSINNVTGSGTSWDSTMVGCAIKSNATGTYYNVASVTDATHLMLSTSYATATESSVAYTISPSFKDEDNNYQGIITLGTNSSITVTYDAINSSNPTSQSQQGTSSITWPAPVFQRIAGWFTTGSNITQLPMYGAYSDLATGSGIPAQTLYIFTNVFFMFLAAVIVTVMTRTIFLGILAADGMLFLGFVQTLYPAWILLVCVLLPIGILFVWRQQ